MSTATFSATMRTRKTNASGNFLSSTASQEFYESGYNLVGIVCFSGMNLTNKVITGISLSVTAARAGLGTWADKVVYLCRSKYQNVTSSYTGSQYAGTALGTFTGSFYGNTTTYTISGDLFTAMAAYMAAGNNTFTLYNPSPTASSQGYRTNYFQWDSVTLTVTYQEAVSVPTVSSSSVTMGSAVTINTNRLSNQATHTLTYSFAGGTGPSRPMSAHPLAGCRPSPWRPRSPTRPRACASSPAARTTRERLRARPPARSR